MRLVTAWFDLEDNHWSGVTSGIMRGLRAAGAFDGVVDVTRESRVVGAVRWWLSATGRLDDAWLLTPEMVALNRSLNALRRWRRRDPPGDFLQFGAFYGRPVRGRLVTFEDRTMAQLPWRSPPPHPPRKMRRLRRGHQRLYDAATLCCVASSWTRESLIRDFGVPPGKIAVVGYGNNVDLDAPTARDWSSARFLFVGVAWNRKNGDAVVRAFTRLRAEQPDARLDVVGEHPPLDRPGVTGHGRLRFDRPDDARLLRALFENATCFVLPSYEEPFGIAYVEAMHAGLPVIATSVGGPHDFVDDTVGAVVEPDDDDALLAAMRRLSDPTTAAAAGAAAHARAAHYTWPAVAARILGELERRSGLA